MFPNFTSVAQREQKRHELMSKADRRKTQSAQKRAMYELADWGSDAAKAMTSFSSKNNVSAGVQTAESSFLNKKPEPPVKQTNEGDIPEVVDTGVNPMDIDDTESEVGSVIESMKRKLSIGEQSPLKFVREPDIEMKSVETSFDDEEWRRIVHFMVKKVKKDGGDKNRVRLTPLSTTSHKPMRGLYLWDKDDQLGIFNVLLDTKSEYMENTKIDWRGTAFYLNSIGVPLPDEVSFRTPNKNGYKSELNSGPFDWEKSINVDFNSRKDGSDRQRFKEEKDHLAIPDEAAKLIIETYCLTLLSEDRELLMPIAIVREQGLDKKYVITLGDKTNPLTISTRKKRRVVGPRTTKDTMKNIVWSGTLNFMINTMLESLSLIADSIKQSREDLETDPDDEDANKNLKEDEDQRILVTDHLFSLRKAIDVDNTGLLQPVEYTDDSIFSILEEANALYDETLREFDLNPSMARMSAVEAAASAVKSAEAYVAKMTVMKDSFDARQLEPLIGPKQVRRASKTEPLVGRGLRGAGKVYQDIERRGKTYNLNDIQGRGLASAHIYQPLGSKYIRIPDLDRQVLNVVYPSRKKLGPKREISSALQSMMKTLIYDGAIDQHSYDLLDHDDQMLFREILAATHIQHSFKEVMTDPLESLKSEYDKLKGEIELGNDNPSIIKQLKVITVDVYRHKLISDDEFKQMIIRL